MELDPYGLAVIAGGFTIVGALVGGLISYWLLRQMANHTEHLRACAKLRATFAPSVGFLDKARRHRSDHERPDASEFLRDAFVTNAAAVEEFRPFVTRKDRPAYQNAWEEYCELAHAGTVDAVFMASALNRDDPWLVLEQRIHAILEFADS